MKITTKIAKVNSVFEFEVKDAKEGFDELAHLNEIFDVDQCGNCGNDTFKLSRRDVAKGSKKFTYREIVCRKCYFRLSLGQKLDDQSLFPQRNDKDGNPKPNHGWTKYEKGGDE